MKRLSLSSALFVIWIAITVGGGAVITRGSGGLEDLVMNGIGWHFALASMVLVAAIRLFGWRDISFAPVPLLPTLRLLWLPVVLLAGLVTLAIATGLPRPAVFVFIGINTLMVGFSEETMLRGIIYSGLRRKLSAWPAIVATSVLFGAMHSLNVFTTGEFLPAVFQSVSAAMSGVLFIAIVIRTGSLVPAVLYHWLWDFAILLVVVSSSDAAPEAATTVASPATLLIPLAIVLPNLLYGLWLFRKVPNDGPVED